MLNVAYKIASGCNARRIKTKLPQIISPDQTGFMADRFIGDNIRLVYDVLAEANTSQKRGLLLLIQSKKKGFDSVSWSFIDKSLIYSNFH